MKQENRDKRTNLTSYQGFILFYSPKVQTSVSSCESISPPHFVCVKSKRYIVTVIHLTLTKLCHILWQEKVQFKYIGR